MKLDLNRIPGLLFVNKKVKNGWYRVKSTRVEGVCFLFGGCSMKRKSYLTNFPTKALFLIMKQNLEELSKLEILRIEQDTEEVENRINQVKLTISLSKHIIINRYLEEEISLTKVAKLLCRSKGIEKEVYQELFTSKLVEANELIALDLLNEAINCLDLDQVMTIMRKKDTIYSKMVETRFDEFIYDVDTDVYENYLEKRKELE